MKILFIGDIVGQPGRDVLEKVLPGLKEEKNIDFVVANAENVAGGSGITARTAKDLFKLGCDVLTSGDHVWRRQEILEIIDQMSITRPLNLPALSPGRGFIICEKDNLKLAVINLQGRVFMPPIDCPFRAVSSILEKIKKETPNIIVDMHAEATSEKVAMGWFLDGVVSAVVGTHTHIQTADEKILPKSTAYITDVGMTGPCDSVIGRKKEEIIERFLTGLPRHSELGNADLQLQGVLIEIDQNTGKSVSIEKVREKIV
ncbi:MAG: TIGR00282 family metallophosphoesterase [Candidatus Omnitrophota bacterium]